MEEERRERGTLRRDEADALIKEKAGGEGRGRPDATHTMDTDEGGKRGCQEECGKLEREGG